MKPFIVIGIDDLTYRLVIAGYLAVRQISRTIRGDATLQPHVNPTICHICKENCGIPVKMKNREIHITGNPRHPVSKGFLCLRGRSFGKFCSPPLRLRQPLMKKGGTWKPISENNALEILAERLMHCEQQYGAESVVFYKREALKHQEISSYMSHLANCIYYLSKTF